VKPHQDRFDGDTCSAAGCMDRDTIPVMHTAYRNPDVMETNPFCAEHAAIIRQQSLATMMLPLLEAHLERQHLQEASTHADLRRLITEADQQIHGWRRVIEYTADIPDPAFKATAAMAEAQIDQWNRAIQSLTILIQGFPAD
jgi:hypothetical protein